VLIAKSFIIWIYDNPTSPEDVQEKQVIAPWVFAPHSNNPLYLDIFLAFN